MAYMLAMMVGLGSFGLYMSAFFFPEVHRKYDLVWSGVGLFYALVLWVCAGRITGGVLLGQVSSVALLSWFSWQNLQLRRDRTPAAQQTQLPDSIHSPDDVVKLGTQTLKSLFNRTAQPTPAVTPSAPAEPNATTPARAARATARPAPAGEPQQAIAPTANAGSSKRSERRKKLSKPAQPAAAAAQAEPSPVPATSTESEPHQAPNTSDTKTPPAAPPSAAPPAEPQDWDEGGVWETAELPIENTRERFTPDRLNSLLEDTPGDADAVDESAPIYLRAELLSEPNPPNQGRRRSRRQRSASAPPLDIPSPYSVEQENAEEDLDAEAIAFGEASPAASGRTVGETRSLRRRRSTQATGDRGYSASAGQRSDRPTASDQGVTATPQPTAAAASTKPDANPEEPKKTTAEELIAPGLPDPHATSSADTDSDDWF